MKALVIGGTGPTGPFIVDGLLRRGYRVTLLHRGLHEVEFAQPVQHLHGDPYSPDSVAALLEGHAFDLALVMYGRLRYLAQVLKGHTKRLIAIGGTAYRCFVEGDIHPERVPLFVPEDAPLWDDKARNKWLYLVALTERMVMDIGRDGACAVTFFRFPRIYGPRQPGPREWSVVRRILDGRRRIIVPDGGLALERRGYGDNMAHAVLLAVDNPGAAAGQTYNAGDEQVLPTAQWVHAIAESMDAEVELVSLPHQWAGPSRPYASQAHHRVVDVTKIQRELGYRDLVPVREALERTVRWLLETTPQARWEIEQQLGDPFDYAQEDRLMGEYERHGEAFCLLAQTPYRYQNPYPAPPGDKLDRR